MSRPRIRILSTGGTIVAKKAPSGELKPALSARELIEQIPEASDFADIEVEDFTRVHSIAVTLKIMNQLATRIKEIFDRGEAEGVVVTHGTDTLEETAAFLTLAIPRGRPVVVTGAMRSPSLVSTDGPINLLNSIRVAASHQAYDLGALVVLNDRIHLASEVTKRHTSNVETFWSPDYGPVGSVIESRVVIGRTPKAYPPTMPVEAIAARVELLKLSADPGDVFLRAATAERLDGLVLEGTGGGHVPPQLLDGLGEALKSGMVIVLSSRSPEGQLLHDTYTVEGGEVYLRNQGVLFSEWNGQKSRIRLALALSVTRDREELRNLIEDL